MLLWLLLAQYNPHDLSNVGKMAYKTDFYRKTGLDAAYYRIHAKNI